MLVLSSFPLASASKTDFASDKMITLVWDVVFCLLINKTKEKSAFERNNFSLWYIFGVISNSLNVLFLQCYKETLLFAFSVPYLLHSTILWNTLRYQCKSFFISRACFSRCK